MKVEVAIVASRYEAVGNAHGVVHDLATRDDQEEDKVIEESLMRISTYHIMVEDSFSEVEKKAEKEDVEKESLT